jgi:mRNA interferase MazF
VDWNPARGSEQAGRRSALVVSNDMGNLAAPTVIVVAVTSRLTERLYPFQVRVPLSARTGLVSESLVNCAQFITISKDRLERRIGALPPDLMRAVDAALRVALGLR